MKFDEVNTMKQIDALYEWLDQNNRKKYKELFIARYTEMLLFLRKAKRLKKDDEDELDELAEMYIFGLLSEPNEVVHYTYDSEVLRKRDRMKEAVLSVPTNTQKQIEIDKNLRFWALASAFFADFASQGAEIEALRAYGAKRVERHELMDRKTCRDCKKADGEIYSINKIPPITHPRCRRWFTPV